MCDRWGIPHSQFLGGEPGRWTSYDRAKAIAYAEYARTVCSGCGTRPEEWDPEAGGDRHAYTASDSRCPGCQAIEHKQSELPEGRAGAGLKVGLVPTGPYLAWLDRREREREEQRRRRESTT